MGCARAVTSAAVRLSVPVSFLYVTGRNPPDNPEIDLLHHIERHLQKEILKLYQYVGYGKLRFYFRLCHISIQSEV